MSSNMEATLWQLWLYDFMMLYGHMTCCFTVWNCLLKLNILQCVKMRPSWGCRGL